MQFPAKTTLEVLREAELRGNVKRATENYCFPYKKKENEYQSKIENKKESKASICVKLPGKEKRITEAIGSSYQK